MRLNSDTCNFSKTKYGAINNMTTTDKEFPSIHTERHTHKQRGYPFLYTTDPANDQNKLWLENRMAGRHPGLWLLSLLVFWSVCLCLCERESRRRWMGVLAWSGESCSVGWCRGAVTTAEEVSRKSKLIVFLVQWVHSSLCLHHNDQNNVHYSGCTFCLCTRMCAHK